MDDLKNMFSCSNGVRIIQKAMVDRVYAPFSIDLMKHWTLASLPGAILPGYQLYLRFVSALHAGGKRVLVAGGKHAASMCTVERAVPSWDDEGTPPVLWSTMCILMCLHTQAQIDIFRSVFIVDAYCARVGLGAVQPAVCLHLRFFKTERSGNWSVNNLSIPVIFQHCAKV